MIKLGEGKEVLAALKGRKPLTQEEIQEVYGSPVPTFDAIEWPKITSLPGNKAKADEEDGSEEDADKEINNSEGPNFWTLATYFDSCKAPQILMGVEMINAGKIDKTYQDLATDILKTVDRQFFHWTADKMLPAKTYGTYFPALFKNPEKYIQPQPELREVLRKLRAQKKFLFLCTNSHYEYAELIMSFTLGKDWRDFFNMVFCNTCKPRFFTDREFPMFLMDRSREDWRGSFITYPKYLKEDSRLTYL